MNYGKDMHNRACFHVTCNRESKLLIHALLDEFNSPILHVPRHSPFPQGQGGAYAPWPWAYACLHSIFWLVVGTSPILHRTEPRRGDKKYKKGSQEGLWPLLWDWPAPMSWECTICCLFNESSVYLSHSWAVTSQLFRILAPMRQELRNPSCLNYN